MRAVLFIPYGSSHVDKQEQLVVAYLERHDYRAVALCAHPRDAVAVIAAGRADVVVTVTECAALTEALAPERIEYVRRPARTRWTVQTMLARLYKSGMGTAELAERLDTPTGDIREHLRRAGVNPFDRRDT